jgi:hypothetical protein
LPSPDAAGRPANRPRCRHSHEPFIERFQFDDVLAAREDYTADRDHIHITDGLADDGKGVVTDFAVRD